MYLEWYQIILLILGTIGCTSGILMYILGKRELASLIPTVIGLAVAVFVLVWPTVDTATIDSLVDYNITNAPIKTAIPYTYQPQVLVDDGYGSILLYKWDYIKGRWLYSIATEERLSDAQIFRTIIQFNNTFSTEYYAYLTVPGYTDEIDLGQALNPSVLRTSQGEFEYHIRKRDTSERIGVKVFDVTSDSIIDIVTIPIE